MFSYPQQTRIVSDRQKDLLCMQTYIYIYIPQFCNSYFFFQNTLFFPYPSKKGETKKSKYQKRCENTQKRRENNTKSGRLHNKNAESSLRPICIPLIAFLSLMSRSCESTNQTEDKSSFYLFSSTCICCDLWIKMPLTLVVLCVCFRVVVHRESVELASIKINCCSCLYFLGGEFIIFLFILYLYSNGITECQKKIR